MIQVEYLPIVLTGIGIMASILYYTSVLRNTNKTQQMQLETRSLQLFMQLYQDMSSPEGSKIYMEIMKYEWDDSNDFSEKYGRNNVEAYSKWTSIFRRYNTMGIFLRDNRLEPEMLYDYVGRSVIFVWNKYEPLVKEWRRNFNSPELYEWFEYLVHEMNNMRKKKGFTEPPQGVYST